MSSDDMVESEDENELPNITFSVKRTEFFDNKEILCLSGNELINYRPEKIKELRKKIKKKEEESNNKTSNLGYLFRIRSDTESEDDEIHFPYHEDDDGFNFGSDDDFEYEFDFNKEISFVFNEKGDPALQIFFKKEGIDGRYSEVYSIQEIQDWAPIFDGKGYEIFINMLRNSPESFINEHEFQEDVYLNLKCLIEIKGFPIKYEFEICLCKDDEGIVYEESSDDNSNEKYPIIITGIEETKTKDDSETKSDNNWTMVYNHFALEA